MEHNSNSVGDLGTEIVAITPTYIMISLGEKGGHSALLTASSVGVFDEDGEGGACMGIDEKGGVVGVQNKDREIKTLTGTGVE